MAVFKNSWFQRVVLAVFILAFVALLLDCIGYRRQKSACYASENTDDEEKVFHDALNPKHYMEIILSEDGYDVIVTRDKTTRNIIAVSASLALDKHNILQHRATATFRIKEGVPCMDYGVFGKGYKSWWDHNIDGKFDVKYTNRELYLFIQNKWLAIDGLKGYWKAIRGNTVYEYKNKQWGKATVNESATATTKPSQDMPKK